MPTTKSSKKRLRQSLDRRQVNRSVKSTIRTQLKKVHSAIEAGELDNASSLFRDASKKLDRAASRNIIHRNRAARLKSRLSARIKAAQQQPAAEG